MPYPLPALDIQQQPGPLDQMGKLMQLKSMMQNQQFQQQQQPLELQQRQQQVQEGALALKDQQAMTDAMHEWDGKDLNALPLLILKHNGSAKAVLGTKNSILDYQTKVATMDKDQLANTKQRFDYFAQSLDNVKSLPPEQQPQAFEQAKADAVTRGFLDAQQAGSFQYKGPKELDLTEKSLMGHSAVVEQALKQQQTQEAAAKTAEAQATTGKTQQEMEWYKAHGMAPGVSAENMGMADYLAKNPGKGPADFLSWKAKQTPMAMVMGNQLPAGANGSNPALDQAAERYAQTGVLPSGFARSPGTLTAIMNRAAELHPGENIAGNEAVYKANSKALGSLQEQASKVGAFEGTALKNLDLYVQTVQKIPDLGSRWANVPLRMVTGKMIGDANYAAMNAARQTAASEVGKVLSSATGSGVLSDAQKREAQDVLDGNYPLAATLKVVETLKQDLGNRHQSYQQEIGTLQGQVGGKAGGQPPKAQGVIYARDPQGKLHQAPAGTALPSGWTQENK